MTATDRTREQRIALVRATPHPPTPTPRHRTEPITTHPAASAATTDQED